MSRTYTIWKCPWCGFQTVLELRKKTHRCFGSEPLCLYPGCLSHCEEAGYDRHYYRGSACYVHACRYGDECDYDAAKCGNVKLVNSDYCKHHSCHQPVVSWDARGRFDCRWNGDYCEDHQEFEKPDECP